MKTLLLSLAALGSSIVVSPAAAQGAPLLLVVEDESATLDAASLRHAVAAASGREVVALGDARAAAAIDSLAVASADGRRWTLRYARGPLSMWRAEDVSATEAAADALARASRALFALASDWTRVNGDVLDPFAAHWDPLEVALRGELVEPFAAAARHASADVLDPFAPPPAWSDLVDPWAN